MSIELTITGITEANKRAKLKKTAYVLAKALAIPVELNGVMMRPSSDYWHEEQPQKPYIPQGSEDEKLYPDIILDIQGITKSNRYEKFIKAVRLTAQQLKLPVGIQTADIALHGERHLYPIKQELSDYWENLYTELLRQLYTYLTEALDLPAFSQEALRKAFVEAEHPRDEAGRFAEKGTSIAETPEEQRLSDKELKATIFDYARKQFQGNIYVNKNTNLEILVSRDGLDKWASVTKTREQALSMKKLDIMLENAISAKGKAQDRKRRKDVTGIRYFDSLININNISYIAHITVRETTGNKNKYYHHYLEMIELEKNKSHAQDAAPFDISPDAPLLRGSTPGSGMLVQTEIQREPPLFPGFDSTISKSQKNASGETLKKSLASDAMGKIQAAFKQFFGNFKVRYQWKVLYNPESGEPLRRKDFDRLIHAVEDVLNANTADAGKRITLDSVTVGKLLQRIAKYQSTDHLHALTLDSLAYKGKSYEWIRQDYANLTTVLGHPLSKQEKARYQVCEDTAAQLVQQVDNDIRNGIKETLLTGIRERKSKAQVSQDLFDKFGSINRSWKRIADTEIVNTSNLASILEEVHTADAGEKVYFKRHEMAGCCKKCEQANGKIALWSHTPLTSDEIEDPFASVAIWDSKKPDSKRGTLVPGAIHPHCRGFWVRWGAEEFNAQAAELNGKQKEWNDAVRNVQTEYKAKGIDTPDDSTKGYTKRINEVYRWDKDA